MTESLQANEKRTLGEKILDWIILTLGAGSVVFQMISIRYLFQTFNEQIVIHLCVGLSLLTFVMMKSAVEKNVRTRLWIFLGSVAVGVSVCILIYLNVRYYDLIQQGDPTSLDMAAGVALIILCIGYTRRFFGYPLVTIALTFVAYTLFGHYLPGPLKVGPYELPYIISKYSVGFEGVLGFILGISVKYVFLFVVFGSLLMATGAQRFLFYVALSLSRHIRSGPVMSAIIPSMLMGTITGVPSANIFITGSFSIPLMKKVGLKPHQAAAYEVSASTGGQIMPPVMGAAAFVMAEFTQSPYIKIVLLAIIPALLFYLSLAIYGHLTVMKMGIRVTDEAIESVGFSGTLKTAPIFVIPLVVITAILVMGFTASQAIFWGILSLVGISLLQGETRLSLMGYLRAFSEGAVLAFKISVLLSVVGLIISSVVVTGLGVKLSYLASGLMGEELIGKLVLVMIACIILGMEVPTSAAYILVSFITAPILVDAGVGLYAAHFFAFYFAVFSVVTPPVAPAAAYGAALAKASYFRTAFESSKLCVAGFLVPYMMVLFPPLLLDFSQTSLAETIAGYVSCLFIILGLQISFVGYFVRRCRIYERVWTGMTTLIFFGFLITHEILTFVMGVLAFLALTLVQMKGPRPKMSESTY
ncbi:MAG: TRAP transporter fused permease subunit [Deltaproteobacteria bacterium]|nr:TRAP transporter fused permease subunit [Deltaproteobacteria bacterium]